VKGGPNGKAELPVHDDNLNLDWRSLDARWRVRAGIYFWQAANAGFYGLGNSSSPTGNSAATALRPTQYQRSELVGQASAAYAVLPQVRVRVGLLGRRVAPVIYPGSTLDLDRNEPLLLGLDTHVSVLGIASIELDTRDQELDPTHGVWLEASVRGSPGPLTGNDFSFGAVTGHARVYQSLWPGRLVLAARVMMDAAFGRPPLHELARGGFTSVWMLGGSDGVQGIPEGRYQGRIRLAMNLELRAHLFEFGLFGQHFRLGLVGFGDAGRVWADWTPRPDLDGTGLGLHPSVGGGLRLRWGQTVLVRFDVAWAPPPASTLDQPVSFYFDLGHIF
jgi:outer membrane protein assembly factor BamA